MTSPMIITLRDPIARSSTLDLVVNIYDTELSRDWVTALKHLLTNRYMLEKNFCFLGFPDGPRNIDFLCQELNQAIDTINHSALGYHIVDRVVAQDLLADKTLLNHVHNHFEILQGTVNNLSDYYRRADYDTKYAIRQLNNVCHELESLILSKLRQQTAPEWVRLSQINTFLNAPRYRLESRHRSAWNINCYDRRMGQIYMHWAQIGKTLFEVYRDESAPPLDDTVCEAITHLEYYSGEFDIEWGNDVVYDQHDWWRFEVDGFYQWLADNNIDYKDPSLSLGYFAIAEIDLKKSFGTDNWQAIWPMLSQHLDVYKIQVDGIQHTFDYCWTDQDYKQQQIAMLQPGYDYSSRTAA